MNQDTILVIVNTYFDHLQAMDMAGWRDLFAEDGITYDPVGNPPSKAHEKAEEFFGLLSSAFAQLKVVPEQIFAAGNGAAVKWRMQVIGKNGRSGQAEGISTFVLDETGKIKEISAYWNDAALMAQIQG